MDSFEASEVLGVPRSTLYRWRRRLERFGPKGLEGRDQAFCSEGDKGQEGCFQVQEAMGHEVVWRP